MCSDRRFGGRCFFAARYVSSERDAGVFGHYGKHPRKRCKSLQRRGPGLCPLATRALSQPGPGSSGPAFVVSSGDGFLAAWRLEAWEARFWHATTWLDPCTRGGSLGRIGYMRACSITTICTGLALLLLTCGERPIPASPAVGRAASALGISAPGCSSGVSSAKPIVQVVDNG
jgi:hypothetical protein